MIKKTTFLCEKCGSEYPSGELADACEQGHVVLDTPPADASYEKKSVIPYRIAYLVQLNGAQYALVYRYEGKTNMKNTSEDLSPLEGWDP